MSDADAPQRRIIIFYPQALSLRLKEDGFAAALEAANIHCIVPYWEWADDLHEAEQHAESIRKGGFAAVIYPTPDSEIFDWEGAKKFWRIQWSKPTPEMVGFYEYVEILKQYGVPLMPLEFYFHPLWEPFEATFRMTPDEFVENIMIHIDKRKNV